MEYFLQYLVDEVNFRLGSNFLVTFVKIKKNA